MIMTLAVTNVLHLRRRKGRGPETGPKFLIPNGGGGVEIFGAETDLTTLACQNSAGLASYVR